MSRTTLLYFFAASDYFLTLVTEACFDEDDLLALCEEKLHCYVSGRVIMQRMQVENKSAINKDEGCLTRIMSVLRLY